VINGTHHPYTFNSKEEQRELGLNLLHYGARFYDPAVAQFTTIDPKSESYASQGGYVYAGNSPISFHEKNGENPILGILKWSAKQLAKRVSKTTSKKALKKNLKKQQKSFQKNVDEHIKKRDDFLKDPVKNSSDEAIKKMTKDNPTKDVLKGRAKGRAEALNKQIQKNQTNLDKVNKQLKDINKTSNNVTKGTIAVTSAIATKKVISITTKNSNSSSGLTTNQKVKLRATMNPSQSGSILSGNAGKLIFGDNSVGNFIDDWINPFIDIPALDNISLPTND